MPQPKKAAMIRVCLVVLTLLILAAYQQSKPQGNTNYNDPVDKTGNIRKPADYLDRYQAFGTFFVRDPVGAEEMHYRYASPGAAEFYRKHGRFADGTVLVKECWN